MSEQWIWRCDHVIPSDTVAGRQVLEELLGQLEAQHWQQHDVFSVQPGRGRGPGQRHLPRQPLAIPASTCGSAAWSPATGSASKSPTRGAVSTPRRPRPHLCRTGAWRLRPRRDAHAGLHVAGRIWRRGQPRHPQEGPGQGPLRARRHDAVIHPGKQKAKSPMRFTRRGPALLAGLMILVAAAGARAESLVPLAQANMPACGGTLCGLVNSLPGALRPADAVVGTGVVPRRRAWWWYWPGTGGDCRLPGIPSLAAVVCRHRCTEE